MSGLTNESDDGLLSDTQTLSHSIDECSSGKGGSVGATVLKKGPWTSAEDAILADYVKKHGEGNWNAVQRHSGLFRCGKSCRLRWANHLRPNLKKGAFTAEEEKIIIELHAKMGNKWAKMAALLPGRTDNEIKNYWNTRIKRHLRAGLPLYPPEICSRVSNKGQLDPNVGNGDTQHYDLVQSSNYVPDVVFDSFKGRLGGFPYVSMHPDMSMNGILTPALVPAQSYSFMPSANSQVKRNRDTENVVSGFSGTLDGFAFEQFQNGTCKKIRYQPFSQDGIFPYDPDPIKGLAPYVGATSCSHAFINGNFSASRPLARAVKLELPSLQYMDTDLCSWSVSCPSSPPSLEVVDTCIQSPPPVLQVQSAPPNNSGLLDVVLHEWQAHKTGKGQIPGESLNSSVVAPARVMDSTALNFCDAQQEGCSDPISPLGPSAALVFSASTPPVSASSLDESPYDKDLLVSSAWKTQADFPTNPGELEKELDFTSMDAVLNAYWFDQSECTKDLSSFLNDDFFSVPSEITSSSNQGKLGFHS